MENLLQVILLGIIEGITEFLPISSTGHLLIAQQWLGRRSELFTVAIQAGAILAVVVIYWRRLLDMTIHFARPEQRDYLYKLAVAFFITVIGGLVAKQLGLELPETVAPVAWALILGGFVIFAVEAYAARQPERDTLTWNVAFWVGIGQIIAAVFPGTSRSAATIFAAMLAGMTSRPAAAEFPSSSAFRPCSRRRRTSSWICTPTATWPKRIGRMSRSASWCRRSWRSSP
jgi:Undecaprenyl-diphosphatase (EC 3.6.1.27)